MTQDEILSLLNSLLKDDPSSIGQAVRLLVLNLVRRRRQHRERILQGLERAKLRGQRLGRPLKYDGNVLKREGETYQCAAQRLGMSKTTVLRLTRARTTIDGKGTV